MPDLATATADDLKHWLIAEGFGAEGRKTIRFGVSADCYRKANVRVAFEEWGRIGVYVYDPQRPRSRTPSLKLDGAPHRFVTDTVARTVACALQGETP